MDGADRAAAERLVAGYVSHETWPLWERLVADLERWQKRINLVSAATLPTVWTRHIADSAQLLQIAPAARRWVDLGSGAGFPGLVLAAALRGTGNASVDMIESDSRKAAFIRQMIAELDLPARIHVARIESALSAWTEETEIVTARALAPLPRLIALAYPLLKTGATGMFLKGRDVDAELTRSAEYWRFDHELRPSRTSEDGRIVLISSVRPL